MYPSKILFGLSGSIACYKAAELISRLVKEGREVQTVCSPSALNFLGPSTLEGLTGKPVLADIFEPGRQMDHIRLCQWADIFIICPATAKTINGLAHGTASEPLGSLFLAWNLTKPIWIVPAMNTMMWQHPATSASVKTLSQWGVQILPTGSGKLACGDVGEGRLLEPEQIYQSIFRASRPSLRFLVIYGGTREAIDDVRFITNFSTGQTGARLADELMQKGHKVSCLKALTAASPQNPLPMQEFSDFADLNRKLKSTLTSQSFDIVIQLAAVSDFSVDSLVIDGQSIRPKQLHKISSTSQLSLKLKKNFKILDKIKAYSHSNSIKVVGFKLTSGASFQETELALKKLFAKGKTDLAVHNDLAQIKKTGAHHFSVHSPQKKIADCESPEKLADTISQWAQEKLEREL